MSDPSVDFPLISLEEKALKAKLQGMTVYDLQDSERPVKVFFRNPQKEIVVGDFPFLTIYFMGVVRAVDREHRAMYGVPKYIPHPLVPDEVLSEDPDKPFLSYEQAIPMDLRFTVATQARNPMHDRQIVMGLLALERLPLRYGWLECEDNTIRRLDVNPNVTTADYYDQTGTQVFRKEFNLTVSSEAWAVMPEEVNTPDVVTTTYVEVLDTDQA